LLVRIEGVSPHFSVPTNNVELLVVSAPVNFSSTLMTNLTQENIAVVFINPRKMEGCTLTTGMMHNDATRRLLQYSAVTNKTLRLHYAQQLMFYKLRLQKNMLRKALRKRKDCNRALTVAMERIANLQHKTITVESIDSLRGVEGAAGAAYFEAYQQLFAPSLGFCNRNRRPPLDPVNVILSLSYTLIHAEAVRCLFSVGFDPLLGIYHEPAFGRESLACDLVELFRPHIDQWIWRLFANETLRPEYFSKEKQGQAMPCMLGKQGRAVYYEEFAHAVKPWRRLMLRVARHWLERVRQDVVL
jgi:CRISPR-associated protein Cas1